MSGRKPKFIVVPDDATIWDGIRTSDRILTHLETHGSAQTPDLFPACTDNIGTYRDAMLKLRREGCVYVKETVKVGHVYRHVYAPVP